MKGFIRARHLITCAPTLVREFGWRSYLRFLMRAVRSPNATFLQSVTLANKSR